MVKLACQQQCSRRILPHRVEQQCALRTSQVVLQCAALQDTGMSFTLFSLKRYRCRCRKDRARTILLVLGRPKRSSSSSYDA